MEINFEVDDKFVIGILEVKDVKVETSSEELHCIFDEEYGRARTRFDEGTTTESYRKLWWKFDMDPTKLRPSNEALLKRVYEGLHIHRINNLVDITNLISLRYNIPIGVHDLDKLNPPITFRKALKDEFFHTIGSKNNKKLNGGELIVADKKNLLDLGISTSSSDLTKVLPSTKNVLVIVYGLESFKNMEIVLEDTAQLIKEFCCGIIVNKEIIKS